MGYEHKELRVTACVSRHNSPKDEEHNKLWAELEQRIEELVIEDKFKAINAMTVY